MAGPRRGIDKEVSINIYKYKNITPEHLTPGTAINQEDNSRYRNRG